MAYFKIKHSMAFINLDELLWMYRSRFFMDNILSFDFSHLIQSSQPGIMVMWITGPFMKIINYDFSLISNFIKNLGEAGIPYNIINDSNSQLYLNYKEISFLFNIPMLGMIFMFIFSLYYLLKKLGLARPAIIFSLLLIVTTPYYIYFTTPTDKLVGIFSTLGLFCLLIYASKNGGGKFLLLSAILCSWAALTKLSALFLVPFGLFVIAVYHRWLHNQTAQELSFRAPREKSVHEEMAEITDSSRSLSRCISGLGMTKIRFFKDCAQWLAAFFITSIIFLPTIITNPRSILKFFAKENSQRIITANLADYDIFLNFKIILAYLSDSFLLSFNLFAIIISIAFFFLIIQKIKSGIKVRKEIIILFSYVFLFFAFIVFFSKIYSFRYLVPALIVFQVLAGVGIYEFANIISKRAKSLKKNEVYFWAIALIIISQGLLIYYSEIQKIENMPSF